MPLPPGDPAWKLLGIDLSEVMPTAADPDEDADPDLSEELERLRDERDSYRARAMELDEIVFNLRALLQSGKGFSDILRIDELLDAFMSVCREHTGAETAAVLLKDDLDPDQVAYRVRAWHNIAADFVAEDGVTEDITLFSMPRDNGLLWQLIEQGEVFSVRDMGGNPRFRVAWSKWNLDVLRSDLWVPLVRGAEVLGVMTLGGGGSDAFRVDDRIVSFLEDLASVAATNIDSTLKYEKNSRILRNIQTLYDINQQLVNVNDFKRLTVETLSTALEAMGAQKANLSLLNPQTRKLEIKVVWGDLPIPTRDGINEGRIPTRSFAIGEGVAGQAAEGRRPVRLNHRNKIEQFGANTVHCILSVPLMYGNEVTGVMTMTNKTRLVDGRRMLDPLGRFSADDAQLAVGLADQAAVNLHKARLYDASITDRLTGLKNARHFEEQLAAGLDAAKEAGNPLVLAVTDIDHFKKFNDSHGHRAGDFVLGEVASLLERALRRSDHRAFRYGGEEFTVLFEDTDLDEALEAIEDWRLQVEETQFEFEGARLHVTVSSGLCAFPEGCTIPEALFQEADRALYFSKESGRNRTSVIVDTAPVVVGGHPGETGEPEPSTQATRLPEAS